jgi:ABC-type transporter Mla MlaB component
MTLLTATDGVFRTERRTGRGRRKRRGEFVPAEAAAADVDSSSGFGTSGRPAGFAEIGIAQEPRPGGCVAMRIRGTIDLATVLPFREAVFTVIGSRPTNLVLDLRGIAGVDISGVTAIVAAVRVASLVNVPVRILPSACLHALLSDTCITQMLAIGGEVVVQ